MKDFNTIWKKLANNKKLESHHFVQRAILIAMRSKRNTPKIDIVHALLQKYFTPATNLNKLNNGYSANAKIKGAYWPIMHGKNILDVDLMEIFENEEEIKQYKQLFKDINYDKLGRKYLYYFTSKEDLTPEQMAVQSAHVTLVMGTKLAHKKINPHGIYFQWIGVDTEKELKEIAKKHSEQKVYFHEPDIGNKLTSIAFEPILWNKRQDFIDYPLMKF